jgi:hypothetical protein
VETDSHITVSKKSPSPKKQTLTPALLLGFLDRVKLLSASHKSGVAAALVEGMPGVFMQHKEGSVSDYELFRIHLKTVVRDNDLDALGFSFTIENRTRYDLVADPESFGVRCGKVFLRQTMSDAPVDIPAQSSVNGYFIVVGDGFGGRNNLLPENNFSIAVRLFQRNKTPRPVDYSKVPAADAPSLPRRDAAAPAAAAPEKKGDPKK